jgi:hypothetical protein
MRIFGVATPLLLAVVGLVALLETAKPGTTLLAAQGEEVAAEYGGAMVARLYYDDIAELDRLRDYDLWEYNNTDEQYVLLSLDTAILDALRRQGWTIQVDEHRTRSMTRSAAADVFGSGYLTVDQHYSDLASINAKYPGLTELVDYGDSYCKENGGCTTLGGDSQPGHDLLAIRVTNETIARPSVLSGTTIISGTKPVFFLIANVHAREITTPELARRFVDWLTGAYWTDADARWIVDWHEIWVIPIVNPDGHWLVELGEASPYSGAPFLQRKNANRSSGCNQWPPSSFSQYGVDLNRNHSFVWGGPGSSSLPCSQLFKGSAAASEPEVAQLQTLIQALIPDQRGPAPGDAAPPNTKGLFITLHSFGELVLWPWGHSAAAAPNITGLRAIGDKLASFNGYLSCQPATCRYAASGTSDDWAYGKLGIPSFTFEVGEEFMPPYDEIDSTLWPLNAPSLVYAARIASAPYALVLGPDVLNMTSTLAAPAVYTFSATIDDRINGSRPISAAQVTIDAPHWVPGTNSLSLAALDGDFDSVVEEVTGVLDLTGMAQGRHTIYLRGQDVDGNWGPVYAVDLSMGRRYDTFVPFLRNDGAIIRPARP